MRLFSANDTAARLLAPLVLGAGLYAAPAMAEDLTAGVVMTKMSGDERYAFLAGVVEGLAYARFAKDGAEEPGMRCVYRWFYETEETLEQIHQAFEHFPDYLPGAVIAAMVEKDCGQ